MNDRSLRTALILSLALNAFLAAAAAAGGVYLSSVLTERKMLERSTPLGVIAEQLDPSARDRLRQTMRTVALSAAPDFEQAHAARRRAADLAGSATFDAAAIRAELAKARASAIQGRKRLEDGYVQYMADQPQPTRVILAKALLGRGSFHMGPHGPHGADGPPPPPGR